MFFQNTYVYQSWIVCNYFFVRQRQRKSWLFHFGTQTGIAIISFGKTSEKQTSRCTAGIEMNQSNQYKITFRWLKCRVQVKNHLYVLRIYYAINISTNLSWIQPFVTWNFIHWARHQMYNSLFRGEIKERVSIIWNFDYLIPVKSYLSKTTRYFLLDGLLVISIFMNIFCA